MKKQNIYYDLFTILPGPKPRTLTRIVFQPTSKAF